MRKLPPPRPTDLGRDEADVRKQMMLGDARALPWPDGSIQAIITSPPYWGQRDYGFDGQIGIEAIYTDYIDALAQVADEARRVLKPDGVLWLNLGDTFNTRTVIRPSSHQAGLGHNTDSTRLSWAQARDQGLVRYSARQPGLKDKDLMLLPYRVAARLVADGWFLRCDIVWSKPYGAPENAPDRPSRLHESIFMLTPNSRCKFYKDACPEGARSVWDIAPGKGGDHRAVFPDELVRRCMRLSTDAGDTVADPFAGSGTVARVARGMGRNALELDGRSWPTDTPKGGA